MALFFTSDTHFQHANIIKYCSRPFSSVDEMNAALCDNWNSVVRLDDIVYHLGDVLFGDVERMLPRLRGLMGKKYLIPGNHDTTKVLESLDGIFEILPSLVEIPLPAEGKAGQYASPLSLCHYPMATWNRSHRGAIMLHGHNHGRLPGNAQRLDVGVDSWGFTPVRLRDVLARLGKQHGLPPNSIDSDEEDQ